MTTTTEQHAADHSHAEEIARRQQEHRERMAESLRKAEEARNDKEAKSRRQAVAIADLALLVVNTGPGSPWDAFQCDEIETLARLLEAHGLTGAAEKVRDEHSDGDDDPSDEHHDRYLVKAGLLVDVEVPDSGSPE